MLEGLELLSAAARVSLTQEQAEAMRTFWRLVLETNKHTNLTRITDDRDVVLKHFIDSLLVLKTGVISRKARVADIGAGAGFPGIPLKITRPDLSMTLIDATLKRVRFLHSVIEAMGWVDVTVVHGRAEQLSRDEGLAGKFDVVVARAVARLDRLLPLCLPFVRRGGHFIAMKGPDVAEEMREANRVLRVFGGAMIKTERLELPEEAGTRTLVVVVKRGSRG